MTVLFTLSAIAACDTGSRGRDQASSGGGLNGDGLTGGTVVFEDDFEREDLGDNWDTRESNAWSIAEGQVVVRDARNAPIWLSVPLPDRVRVEFDVIADTAIGDIKFEIFGNGRDHESGYICIYGGWDNSATVIARLDEHGSDRLDAPEHFPVVPAQTYHFIALRTDNRLRWFIDGQERLTYEDSSPLVGDGHRFMAFNNWMAPARFDNIVIYDLE